MHAISSRDIMDTPTIRPVSEELPIILSVTVTMLSLCDVKVVATYTHSWEYGHPNFHLVNKCEWVVNSFLQNNNLLCMYR